jgi:hypothetical protein
MKKIQEEAWPPARSFPSIHPVMSPPGLTLASCCCSNWNTYPTLLLLLLLMVETARHLNAWDLYNLRCMSFDLNSAAQRLAWLIFI